MTRIAPILAVANCASTHATQLSDQGDEFRAKLVGIFTYAMQVRADAQLMERADVRAWLAEWELLFASFAALGRLPLDTAAFMIDVLRGGTGGARNADAIAALATPSPQLPPVINITTPTPVVNITNEIDATPRGNVSLVYDKLGRLAELERTPAKSEVV